MSNIFKFFAIGLICAGCNATIESRLDSIRGGYMTTPPATEISDKNNLDLLIGADALFHSGDIAGADAAYELFNKKNPDVQNRGNFLREVSTLAFGANANDYRPYMMDSLFVSYYQLWAALADGRRSDARVIINQSYARQIEMSRAYEKLLETRKNRDENSELVNQLRNENSKWTAYHDIMNPALMYLSGLYFLTAGDFDDAQTYLGRANGMMPTNEFIRRDLDMAKTKRVPQNMVWVFIEDGFAPKLTERRLSLPVLHNNGITMTTIAVSEPVFFSDVKKIDGAQKLADVDAMFMTEYGEYQINEALRAFAAAASRTFLQAATYNSHSKSSSLLGLMSTIYSEVTNSPEIRTWATLPKTISVMRMQNNKSGLIEIKSNGTLVQQVSVPTSGNYLVYIRIGPNGNDTKVINLK